MSLSSAAALLRRPLVCIASPYRGDIARNTEYLQRCVTDSIVRGELPFAPHGFLPHFLDDSIREQRHLGIHLGHQMILRAELLAVYTDLGISPGMEADIHCASKAGVEIAFRSLAERGAVEDDQD